MMLIQMVRKLVPLAAAGVLALMSMTANATLLKSYDFDGDLSDTLGNGVDLTASGGSIAGGRYSFGINEGLRLTSALPSTTDYAIEMRLQNNDGVDDGYNKLIDFQELVSDSGLYTYGDASLGPGIDFFPEDSVVGMIFLATDFTVGLARASGSIELFLNGVSIHVIGDGAGEAVPLANILNFFEDDTDTSQSESFMGSVDFIRIHEDSSTFGMEPPTPPPPDSSIPEPATLLLLGLGLAGLGFARRRLH